MSYKAAVVVPKDLSQPRGVLDATFSSCSGVWGGRQTKKNVHVVFAVFFFFSPSLLGLYVF